MKQITYFQYLKFPFESGRGRLRRPKQDLAGKTLDLEAPCLESGAHNGMIWVLADSGSPTPHGFSLGSPSLCTCVCFLCSWPRVLPSPTPCISIAIQTLTTSENLRLSLQGIWPYYAWPDLNGVLPPWCKPSGAAVKLVLWRPYCQDQLPASAWDTAGSLDSATWASVCWPWGNTPVAIGQGSSPVAFSV